jgi:hypothetical protein
VEYLVEDSRTVILCPEFSVKRSDSDMVQVFSIGKGDRFIKIYRLRPKEK